jgi:hypothetical protein
LRKIRSTQRGLGSDHVIKRMFWVGGERKLMAPFPNPDPFGRASQSGALLKLFRFTSLLGFSRLVGSLSMRRLYYVAH